uniref:Ig-like domain-containing protein n=1 Tax=Cyprinus carpio TaxID=7962 RepID=A0A8C1JV68_CYPCA
LQDVILWTVLNKIQQFKLLLSPVNEDMIKREGESVTMSCSYDTRSNDVYLYWYRQYLNREPEYLLYEGARSNSGDKDTPDDDRIQSTASQSSTELIITDVTLSDSALYYCALRVAPTVTETHSALTQKP